MTMHYIVYPVRKRILESEIRDQYRDAVANGEADGGYDAPPCGLPPKPLTLLTEDGAFRVDKLPFLAHR